jgi:hypothetical protein
MTFRNWTTLALVFTAVAVTTPSRGFAAENDAAVVPASQEQIASLSGDAFQALVTKVVRKVEWQRFHTRLWQGAALNNLLMVGDTLRTGTDAKAELLYGDGSVTRVGSLTSLTLAGDDHRELHLDGGKVWLHIMKHNAGMRIITPGAVAAVTGTELLVEFDAVKRTTEVTVFEGAVNVTGDVGNIVRVTGGTTSHVPFHAPAAPAAPMDNRKLLERENIFKPLSLEDSNGTKLPDAKDPNGHPTTPDSKPAAGTAVTTTKPATANPEAETPAGTTAVAPVTATAPVKPVQPDLKGQTDKLLDPRVINGSPTTGRVKVIIK